MSTTEGTDPGDRGHGAKYPLTFGALTLSSAGYGLPQGLVIPALPLIAHQLHTSQNTVTWVLTAFLLSNSVATPLLGRLGDIYGKHRVFRATMVLATAGALLASFSNSIGLLIFARVIQGVGGASIALAIAVVRDEAPPSKVAGSIGLLSALGGAAAGIGIVVGGVLAQHLGFHSLFWTSFAVTMLGTIGVFLFVPPSRNRSPARINWMGALLLSAFLVALLVGVSEGPQWNWTSPSVMGLLVGALILGVLWVRSELRATDPMIDIKMMRLRPIWTCNLVTGLLGVGMYALFLLFPPFVQAPASTGYGFGTSASASGLFLLPFSLALFVGGLVFSRFLRYLDLKSLTIIGCVMIFFGFAWLTLFHHDTWELYFVSAITGAGAGLGITAVSNIVVHAVPINQTGVASGMNSNVRTVGGSVGAQIAVTILTSGVAAMAFPSERHYTITFAFVACISALALLASTLIPRKLVPNEAPGERLELST